MTDLAELILVRHGQSVANAAYEAAAATGRTDLGLSGRDADIDLSPLGERQSERLGQWLATLPPSRRPEVAICSPYRRAVDTWRIAAATATVAGAPMPSPRLDARLVDRGAGEFELRHPADIARRYPGEAARRDEIGPYRYRPPGGESLLDVADRAGAVLTDLRRDCSGRRVLIVAHDAVVLMARYVIEDLSFAELDRAGLVGNAAITRYDGSSGALVLAEYNVTVC